MNAPIYAIALAAAMTSVPALAADPPAPRGDAQAGAASQQVRNWAEIDTNRDNLISAEEMERWLQAQWAAQKKN